MPCTHDEELKRLVRNHAPLMACLEAVRDLRLARWCIGAGAIRSLVWDARNGLPQAPFRGDLDVVHFDARPEAPHDRFLQEALSRRMTDVCWEVTNQAQVHRWFHANGRHDVRPFDSLEAGVASWPEYATCVGVRLEADGSLSVVAPHGLGDLFGLVVRHNPARADAATFWQRVREKRFLEQWPALRIIDPELPADIPSAQP